MNRYRTILLLSLTAACVGLSACATRDDQPARPGGLTRADQTFLENAAQGNHAEVQGSRLAQEKATSKDVKTFAAAMIEDHSMANMRLASLAERKGYSLPTEPSVMQRTELRALNLLSGNAFDKAYVDRIGVAAHRATIEQFETAASEADDADIRAFAEKMLPTLRHHLEMAEALNEQQKLD